MGSKVSNLGAAFQQGFQGAFVRPPKPVLGTTYTFAVADCAAYLQFANADGCTATVPPNSQVPCDIGKLIVFEQTGAGAVTIAAGDGVTVNALDDVLDTSGQFDVGTLIQTAPNVWTLLIAGAGGGGGDFIPLTGTVSDHPVTGNIVLDDCGIDLSGIASTELVTDTQGIYLSGTYTYTPNPYYDATNSISLKISGYVSTFEMSGSGDNVNEINMVAGPLAENGTNTIQMSAGHNRIRMYDYGGDTNSYPTVSWGASRGTPADPLPLQQYDREGVFGWQTQLNNGGSPVFGANSFMFATLIEPGDTTKFWGSDFELYTTLNGTEGVVETLRLSASFGLQMFGTNTVVDENRLLKPRTYLVSTLPDPSVAGSGIAAVSDATLTPAAGLGLAPTGSGSYYSLVYVDANTQEWVQL